MFTVASLMNCLHHLKKDNTDLEDRVKALTLRRDHLLAVNARLAVPTDGSTCPGGAGAEGGQPATPQGDQPITPVSSVNIHFRLFRSPENFR